MGRRNAIRKRIGAEPSQLRYFRAKYPRFTVAACRIDHLDMPPERVDLYEMHVGDLDTRFFTHLTPYGRFRLFTVIDKTARDAPTRTFAKNML